MNIKEFKKIVEQKAKVENEYKDYLAVCGEAGMPWYTASKTVMETLHPNEKLTAGDYTEINKLRYWYKEQYGEAREDDKV